jgi:GDP-L-fucose synthase
MNINVLEAARLLGIQKTALTLSTGMYPVDAPNPIVEDVIHNGNPHPTNYSYSFAKRLIDPSIRAYRTEYGINAIGLAVNGIFGPNMNFREGESIMVAALIRRFYENRDNGSEIVIWGDGSPLREYTYSQDLARAFMWCLENYNEPQFLNIGSTEETSVNDTALMIADLTGVSRERVVFDTSKPAGIHRKATDNTRFTGISHFQYTPFRIGMEKTVEWFIQHYAEKGAVRL